jgi:tRNA A-37 threonylcarbamoyl transferase component Bud32
MITAFACFHYCRLSSTGGGTTAVALKLAPWPSHQAQVLAREGSVLLAIMPLWGRYVPPLLALGRGQGGHSFMLATRYLQGRHLDPARDAHLAPLLALAVEQLHTLGVAHCDLRSENVMVVQEQGQERVWLIDFGHARQGAGEDEFQRDADALAELCQGQL